MWTASLAGFGAILSLAASGANANVVCDAERALGVAGTNTSQDLQDTTKGFFTDRCESIVLTITHMDDASPSDIEGCIAHFGNIIDQCISTKSVQGGTVLADEALYGVYAVNTEKSDARERDFPNEGDEESALVVRRNRIRGKRRKDQTEEASNQAKEANDQAEEASTKV
ncbi:hypothetical protein K458DRAFT_396904 [Lentithecium fluviatile CBS 122367]|uniref:Uncharacterized protein n=1 Tax=Lentithecium fluviatile CBS 122367 TaxID=1168545 RepID=A0A6G1IEZ2_9PLEO|nr:hypothetical protein K458DRAFT_396904 [Lentithecium fluviatile CBS 122367]